MGFELPKPKLSDGLKFKVEILDTWNMKVAPVQGVFTLKKKTDYFYGAVNSRSIALPGRPYMAIRIKRD